MRKALFSIGIILAGLYLTLHLVLGSSPVQRRVLSEIRDALSQFGLDLEIESIEFSAFTPRIFLNRVTLKPTDKLKIPLPEPLAVDKIKIQFQPLALLSKQIIIDEAVLFFPKIIIPQADELYRRVSKLVEEKKKMVVKGGSFNVVFKKIGVVDALFEVVSHNPSFAIRSRSLSFFIEQNTSEQQTITVSSKNLEFDRGALKLKLNKADLDIDATPKSLRANQVILEGEGISVNLKGAATLPLFSSRPGQTFRATYQVGLGLALLNDIPELKLPKLGGKIDADGTVELKNSAYSGSGIIKYDSANIEGYGLGAGSFRYDLNQKRANLSQVNLSYAEGTVTGQSLAVDFTERFPVSGDLKVSNLRINRLMQALKVEEAPVFGLFSGNVKVAGSLVGPLALEGSLYQSFSELYVLDKVPKGKTYDNTIIEIPEGTVNGTFSVAPDRLTFKSEVKAVDGTLSANGVVHFDNRAQVKLEGQGLSLTKLGHIAEVPFGGVTNLKGVLDINGKTAQVGGDFEITNAEIAEIVLGPVKGTVHYQDKLLSFERLELPSVEPIYGSGFVDFRPKDNHYRFQVNAKRASINQVFDVFKKQKLDFPKPVGGEVGARVTIEGGHDPLGLEVKASGQAKAFAWYDERWITSNFALTYRRPFVEIHRASFLKKSGALDVRAHFEGMKTFIAFSSQGLRLEEFTYFGKAPISGELAGALRLEGKLDHPSGSGDLRITKAAFRGNPIPDSTLKIRTNKNETEFLANVSGDRLRARLLRREGWDAGKPSDLLLYFKEFDFAPLLSVWLGKDIPPLGEMKASGDISLRGIFENWDQMSGSGTITDLNLGLRNAPMRNESPIHLALGDGTIKVERFKLTGADTQLAVDFLYQPHKLVKGGLDGKLDLQHLQPFIPGLEYGIGKVGVGLRLSGKPPDYSLLGNITLEEGVFRITGIADEFKNSRVQLSLSQDRINVDRFDAQLGGGNILVRGDVRIGRFKSLSPNLTIGVSKVNFKTKNFLTTQVTGDLILKGDTMPYLLSGRCQITEARLSDFNMGPPPLPDFSTPVLRFDIKAEARDKLFVTTDVMDAEFKGNFHLLGNTSNVALLGSVEGVRGSLLFKETKFAMTNAIVKFEDPQGIMPRFNVSGKTVVREQRSDVPQDYEVNLQAFGTPKDYRIQLTSTPALAEGDLISLLILGVTTKSQDGNFIDLGSVIAGQTPFQSKLQDEFGVKVKMGTQTGRPSAIGGAGPTGQDASGRTSEVVVPSVKIQKDISNKTKFSYSQTVGEEIPYKEFRIEHMLNDSFTVNGTAIDRSRSSPTDSVRSYGLDFRYHFTFE